MQGRWPKARHCCVWSSLTAESRESPADSLYTQTHTHTHTFIKTTMPHRVLCGSERRAGRKGTTWKRRKRDDGRWRGCKEWELAHKKLRLGEKTETKWLGETKRELELVFLLCAGKKKEKKHVLPSSPTTGLLDASKLKSMSARNLLCPPFYFFSLIPCFLPIFWVEIMNTSTRKSSPLIKHHFVLSRLFPLLTIQNFLERLSPPLSKMWKVSFLPPAQSCCIYI